MKNGLRKKDILNILNKNFNYSLVDTKLGQGVELDEKEAFIFSSITGSAYLENFIFPYTPKGLMKVFRSALDYKFVTGLYDNSNLFNTPYRLNQKRPYLFDNKKIVVPIEINSEMELKEKLMNTYGDDTNQCNIIILRIEISKQGHGLESFMEYLACKYYNSLGYITENQIPLFHNVGSPDFAGYYIKDILKSISEKKILPNGFNIIELAMLRFNKKIDNIFKNKKTNLIVGEAKTSTIMIEKQLNKYLKTGFYNQGIEIHPNKNLSKSNKNGILTVVNDEITFIPSKREKELIKKEKQKEYIDWLRYYFTFYILSNYSNDELSELSLKILNKKITSVDDIITLAKIESISNHLDILLGYLENGTFK